MSDGSSIGKMLFMTGGLLVWAVHFTIIYGFTTVACTKDFAITNILGFGIVPLAIGAATLVALATTGAVLIAAISGPIPPRSARYGEITEHFMQYTTVVIAALSLIAITWNALPAIIVSPC